MHQIVEMMPNSFNAGAKAVNDVASIASRMGFKLLPISKEYPGKTIDNQVRRQRYFKEEWKLIYHSIDDGSIVLLGELLNEVPPENFKTGS